MLHLSNGPSTDPPLHDSTKMSARHSNKSWPSCRANTASTQRPFGLPSTSADERLTGSSVRQYKKRIQDWELDKKLKEDDVLQILRILATRDPSRKHGVFFARGGIISGARIRKYIARNPRVIQRFNAGEIPARESVEGVTLREDTAPIEGRRATQSDPVERILWSTRVYLVGSFDSGAWVSNATDCWSASSSPASELSLHDVWHKTFLDTLHDLITGTDAEATGRRLNHLFDTVRLLVKANPPYLLSSLFTMVLHLRSSQHNQLSMVSDFES